MSVNHKNPTKVVTGVVRLSYANVWEPASINGSNPKYSVLVAWDNGSGLNIAFGEDVCRKAEE